MPGPEIADTIHEVGADWRLLLEGWAEHGKLPTGSDSVSLSARFDLPDTGATLTARFTTTSRLLVAFMTNGRALQPDQLAVAAAAANAWNTEHLTPMLSVWDVRGPHPCIAGVCTLPLSCRLTRTDFDALITQWIELGRGMFTRCHQFFHL